MTNILPALFGLIGVIVGGLITAASSYLLERRREEREHNRERRGQAALLRQASRLIDEELSTAINSIRFAQQKKRWYSLVLKPAVTAWQQYRSVLALGLPTDVWSSALRGYSAVEQLITLGAAISGSDAADRELEKDTLEFADQLRGDIEEARKAIAPFTRSDLQGGYMTYSKLTYSK
jgi:hypothetical protein